MCRIAAPLIAVVLMTTVARADDVLRFNCEVDYPDGSFGVALVKVVITDQDAPTAEVSVVYFSEGYDENLGYFETWSEPADYPMTEQEAIAYAAKHFFDKW